MSDTEERMPTSLDVKDEFHCGNCTACRYCDELPDDCDCYCNCGSYKESATAMQYCVCCRQCNKIPEDCMCCMCTQRHRDTGNLITCSGQFCNPCSGCGKVPGMCRCPDNVGAYKARHSKDPPWINEVQRTSALLSLKRKSECGTFLGELERYAKKCAPGMLPYVHELKAKIESSSE